MENVKHMTNFAGIKTMEGNKKIHISKKKAAIEKEITAYKYDLSFPRKLKIESHPCGSGSGRPSTKFLAWLIVEAILKDAGLLSTSLEEADVVEACLSN